MNTPTFTPTTQPLLRHLHEPGTEVISVHQHIDNGGHTLSVDQYGNMIVETGFFGYSHTSVMLSAVDLDGMVAFLQRAKTFVAAHSQD